MNPSWPQGLGETLWNYNLLQIQNLPSVPMMGVKFAPGFLYAFAFGCAFVVIFAWKRFGEISKEPKSGYRVIREIEITQLGGSNALRRAYMIYAGTLLTIYIAMTFFGKLMLQTLNQLPIAGVQVDVSQLRFDNAEWPLTLAFGLAGLGPLLPPLQLAEEWLRQRAYRAVGIPVRIEQTTRKLVEVLDAAAKGRGGASLEALRNDLLTRRDEARSAMVGTWLGKLLDLWPARREELLVLHAQLELLVDWAKGDRGSWPGVEVSGALRDLEARVVADAEGVLGEFRQRISEGQELAGQGQSGTAVPEPGAHEDKGGADETTTAREQRRRLYLAKAAKDMRQARNDLVAFLAVYSERDPAFEAQPAEKTVAPGGNIEDVSETAIADDRLRELLIVAKPYDLAGSGPEFGIAMGLIPAFLLYAIFSWKGLHPAFWSSADPGLPAVIATTAALETLRLLVTVWFPLLAAFSLRQYFLDQRDWVARAKHDPSRYVEQRLAALGVALLVGVIGLIGLALLWAFAIAVSAPRFAEILFGGVTPFLLLYPSMALIIVPLVLFSLQAADVRARGGSGVTLGIVSGVCVAACYLAHLAFWYGAARACTAPEGAFLHDILKKGCFAYYGALDLFVLPILAFLAAAIFGNPASLTARRRRERANSAGRLAIQVILVAAGTTLAIQAAQAQDVGPPAGAGVPQASSPAAERARRNEVAIGFRADVEPFSYETAAGRQLDGSRPAKYAGYLADLCYEIFDGSGYSVVEVEVTGENRFQLLRDETIDVLCDPVTMRFSDARRTEAGIFSPIVFASGVSYLLRRERTGRSSVEVTYLGGSTAQVVARRACEIDLFVVVPPDQRSGIQEMCDRAWAVAALNSVSTALDNTSDVDDLCALRDAAVEANTQAKRQRDIAEYSVALAPVDSKTAAEMTRDNWKAAAKETDSIMRLVTACPSPSLIGSQVTSTARENLAGLRSEMAPALGALASALGMLDAEYAVHCAPTVDEVRKYEERMRKEQQGPTRLSDKTVVYRFCPMRSHTKMIDWFCGPRYGAASTIVYLGDRELILGKLRSWNNANARCSVENAQGADDLTYEPYTILTSKKRLDIVEVVQRRIYEFFSHRERATGHFSAYFPKRTMSMPLAYLFLLNGVEEERLFANPPPPLQSDQ